MGIWRFMMVLTGREGEIVERVTLTHEVAEFLYREADLLDERRYEEWLDLLTDDVSYTMPLSVNVKFGEQELRERTHPGSEVCWFDEGKETLRQRVEQILTGVHWAEEPFSRVSHLITNVSVKQVVLPEVTVGCRFLLYRNRVADETDILVGKRTDTLRMVDGDWKICRRQVLLDQNVLLAKNLTVFF